MSSQFESSTPGETLPRIAIEAVAGLGALTLLTAMAAHIGLRALPPESFALGLGLAYLVWGCLVGGSSSERDGRRVLRGAGAALAALLVLAPLGFWLPEAIEGAGVAPLLGVLIDCVVFAIAAAAAGLVLKGAAEGGPRLALSGASGGGATTAAPDAPVLPRREALQTLAVTTNPAGPWLGGADLDIRARDDRGDDVAEIPEHDLARQRDGWLEPERLPDDWLDGSGARQEGRAAAAVRRAMDIALSAGLLLGTLPLLLLTAIAIRLETRGPVFYRQERVGRHGRVFTLFKFRSMTVDAEAPGQAIWAVPQDPRVTRVGRFIRLTRIDEVPQVLNVLRGDMAFIGPRPERPVFVAQLDRVIPRYADRAAVKPGITGWAQVRYRYGASVEDSRMKLGYDLYYIRHRSLALDLRILAATVRVVLLQEGAR